MDYIYNVIWTESFWFPTGTTWKDLENEPGSEIYLPQTRDLNWSVLIGVLLLIFRYTFECLCIVPLAQYLGVKEKKVVPVKPNVLLEGYFKKNGIKNGINNNNNNKMESMAKQTDMTVRQVEVWFRHRKAQSSYTSKIQKFCECSWHFLFYFTSFWYGVIVLWNKSWLWRTRDCFVDWPKQPVQPEIFIYYLMELSFYWSLVFSHVTDHKRKDFKEMIIHHIATILLIYFSFSANYVRSGTLVLITHDAADYWMAAAKMAKYTNHSKLCDFLFICFAIVWIASRLIYFPFCILYMSYFEMPVILGPYPSHAFFNSLLTVLMVLHLIWTYMIYRLASQKLVHGQLQRDVRSDTSEPESEAE